MIKVIGFCSFFRYLIASHTTDYHHPMLFLNTVAVMVLVVAKLPNMHKVRIFGINSGNWGSFPFTKTVFCCFLFIKYRTGCSAESFQSSLVNLLYRKRYREASNGAIMFLINDIHELVLMLWESRLWIWNFQTGLKGDTGNKFADTVMTHILAETNIFLQLFWTYSNIWTSQINGNVVYFIIDGQ